MLINVIVCANIMAIQARQYSVRGKLIISAWLANLPWRTACSVEFFFRLLKIALPLRGARVLC